MSRAEELGFRFDQEPCWNLQFIPEHVTSTGLTVPAGVFPCGKCLPCLRHRRDEWVRRLTEELDQHDFNFFVTLTYDDDNIIRTCDDPSTGEVLSDEDDIPQVWKPHIFKFHADLRKRFQQGFYTIHFVSPFDGRTYSHRCELPTGEYPLYYLTSEYGPLHSRPHYHAVYYGCPGEPGLFESLVRELWPYGFVSVFPAEPGSAGYISKYLVKDAISEESTPGQLRPFSLMSKGLGKGYVERMSVFHNADPVHRQYYQSHGQHGRLSRYYRTKIFSEEFRQEHAYDGQMRLIDIYNKYKDLSPEDKVRVYAEKRKYMKDQIEAERWKEVKHRNFK